MLAEWIKKSLSEYGNHAEIARRAKVDRTQVSRLATGGRGVRLETLYRVIAVLDDLGYKLGSGNTPQAEERRWKEVGELVHAIRSEAEESAARIRDMAGRLELLLRS